MSEGERWRWARGEEVDGEGASSEEGRERRGECRNTGKEMDMAHEGMKDIL